MDAARDDERGRALPAVPAGALAVVAGLATWLAFPPVAWWPLALVGVAGLSVATARQRARRGAWLGALFGAAMFGPLLSWIAVLGPDTLVLLGLLEALFGAALGAALATTSRLRAWPLLAACLWVAVELARSWVPFGGFPWGRLAHTQASSPLGTYAVGGGMALVTAVVALVGALVAAAVVGPRRLPAAGIAAGGAVALLLGGLALAPDLAGDDGPVTRVALVQGNVPGAGMDALGEARTVTRNHLAATEELAERISSGEVEPVQVVIWPENSTDIDPLRDAETKEVVEQAVEAVGVPVLVGAILDGPGEDYRRTAGVVWDPVTGPDLEQVYVKRHPVPFGEYIPFRRQLLPLVGRLEEVGRETFAGSEPGLLEIGGTTFGDVICFEIAYDDIVRDVVDGGAEVLVVQTNNATFGGTAQPEQQFAISRMRAIETGRTVLVASTNGISGVIAPDGSVVERTETGTRDVLVHTVKRVADRTLASRLGAWPEWLLTAAGLAGVVVAAAPGARQRARRRRGDGLHG